jgi:hypothetical protein
MHLPAKKNFTLFLLIPVFCVVLFGFLLVVQGSSSIKGAMYLSSVVLIKNLRENFASLFVFGSYDRANWHLTLSQKRLAEAQKLLVWGDLTSARRFLQKSIKESALAKDYFKIAADSGEDVNYLKKIMAEIEIKQKELVF